MFDIACFHNRCILTKKQLEAVKSYALSGGGSVRIKACELVAGPDLTKK